MPTRYYGRAESPDIDYLQAMGGEFYNPYSSSAFDPAMAIRLALKAIVPGHELLPEIKARKAEEYKKAMTEAEERRKEKELSLKERGLDLEELGLGIKAEQYTPPDTRTSMIKDVEELIKRGVVKDFGEGFNLYKTIGKEGGLSQEEKDFRTDMKEFDKTVASQVKEHSKKDTTEIKNDLTFVRNIKRDMTRLKSQAKDFNYDKLLGRIVSLESKLAVGVPLTSGERAGLVAFSNNTDAFLKASPEVIEMAFREFGKSGGGEQVPSTTSQKDQYGFTVGDLKQAQGGVWEYMGNNQWRKKS